jgi:Protein of unknown function (DUF3071)
MQELRLVAVSEDGSYAVLVVPGRSGRFALPIDERLRTVARGQFSRLAQYEIEVESPLRPKEIQDRIRAGETAEEIADAAGLPVDRIRRFEGPPLAERARWAQEAQQATVRGRGETGPGPRLGAVVADRLAEIGAGPDDVEWDSRKRQDGSWQLQLAYTLAGRLHVAEWVYDNRSKHVTPDDDEAIRLCLDEAQWPEPRPAARSAATATVTPIGSRSTAAAHHDQRADIDRPAGRAIVHPSRQAPAVPPAGIVRGQPVAPLRASSATADAVTGADRGAMTRGEPVGAAGAVTNSAGREVSGESVPAAREALQGAEQPDSADAVAQPAEEAAPAGRPAKRSASGRARRSSVPSWDEIMFGTSRQPD